MRGALGEEFGQVAGLIDRNGALQLAALDRAFQHQKIWMGLGGHQAAYGVMRRGAQRSARRVRRGPQQAARGAIGEAGLARSLDPAQQPGVVQPAAVQGVEEGFLSLGIGDQIETVARMLAQSSRSSTTAQRRAETASTSPVASRTTHRSG